MNVNWKTMLIAGLTVCLAVSLFFNGYFYYELTKPAEHQGPTFFSFVWSPEQQNITEGPLYVNMTFERIGEILSVIIEINDDDYQCGHWTAPDALILWFDVNGDGYVGFDDLPVVSYYWLKPDNTTLSRRLVNPLDLTLCGAQPQVPPKIVKSPVHACTFKQGEGYVFNCTFPLKSIGSDVVTLRFNDVNGSVYISPFHFGVDVT